MNVAVPYQRYIIIKYSERIFVGKSNYTVLVVLIWKPNRRNINEKKNNRINSMKKRIIGHRYYIICVVVTN